MSKIRNFIVWDIKTNTDAKQIIEHKSIVNMINIGDFDPFNAWTTASLPLNQYDEKMSLWYLEMKITD